MHGLKNALPLLWSAMGQNGEDAAESGDAALDTGEIVNIATESIGTTLREILAEFAGHLPLIIAAILVIVATWIVAKIIEVVMRRVLKRTEMRGSLKQLLHRFIAIAVWAIGLMLAAMVVFPDLTPTSALAGLGIGSVAIGFAFKDIFENFFAGILILWRFPVEDGYFIECEGVTGKVDRITIRNTIVCTVSGELVVIPNSTIFKNPLYVLTGYGPRRITVIAGVAYDEDVDQSREVIAEAVRTCSTVHSDRPIEIFAQEFASSSINFEVTWWTDPEPVARRRSRDEVVAAVKRALDDAGIEIPFPYRTLTFKESLNIHQSKTENGEPDA
jgi:small-conductance mechanosensitive channel